MDKISQQLEKNRELEAAAERRENAPTVSTMQVKAAAFVAFAGAALFDISSAWIIYTVTGYWPYGVGWIIGGGGGLIFAEWLKSRIGNNTMQRKISEASRNVSAVAIVGMSLISGLIMVLKIESQIMEAVFVVSVVCLFFFHLIQAFRYREIDDEYLTRNKEARRIENHKARMRELDEAAEEVEKAMRQAAKEKEYQDRYGEAFGVAYGKSVDMAKLDKPNPTPADPKQ
jgi:hypothetical protein